MRETIKQILMQRDGLDENAAQELINEAEEAFNRYLDEGDTYGAENICEEFFGLEPDYLDEFI